MISWRNEDTLWIYLGIEISLQFLVPYLFFNLFNLSLCRMAKQNWNYNLHFVYFVSNQRSKPPRDVSLND